jgi:hypothetical protein
MSTAVSVGALLFYHHRDGILLYGDAVAHLNIARRVFDSRTPGLFQLGTVWLPLPHVVDIPFIINHRLWQSGLGASIPSTLAYVAGTLGVFRLVRGLASRVSAWIATLTYSFNPNLIYMQGTAMTEALYLALFIWAVVHFSEFAREKADPQGAQRSLEKCGLAVAAAMLVRYDGWLLALVIAAGAGLVIWRRRPVEARLRRGATNFIMLTALTAGLWLAYNYAHYGNALEFANGPYSAHSIQQRTRTATMPSYPGENSPRTAAQYFMKVSRLNLGNGRPGTILLGIAFTALLAVAYFARKFLPWAVLWTPALFYVICIAWGSVPIYLPDWWPFSYYNVRYGLQMLPAVSVFVGVGCELLSNLVPVRLIAVAIPAASLVAASYATLWQHTPICLREAEVNGRARLGFDRQLASELGKLPPAATIMMDCSAHPGAVQQAGIHFRRVLRESNPPYWELALVEPALAADYVVAMPGDDLSFAVRRAPRGLKPIATVGAPPGPAATIYQSTRASTVLQSGRFLSP